MSPRGPLCLYVFFSADTPARPARPHVACRAYTPVGSNGFGFLCISKTDCVDLGDKADSKWEPVQSVPFMGDKKDEKEPSTAVFSCTCARRCNYMKSSNKLKCADGWELVLSLSLSPPFPPYPSIALHLALPACLPAFSPPSFSLVSHQLSSLPLTASQSPGGCRGVALRGRQAGQR